MQSIGVTTPVTEPTDWVSAMVVPHKKNNSGIRLFFNPKDLKLALKMPHHPMHFVKEVAVQMSGAAVISVREAKKNSFWQISLDKKFSMMTTSVLHSGGTDSCACPLELTLPARCFTAENK